jgi:hypothetical protein
LTALHGVNRTLHKLTHLAEIYLITLDQGQGLRHRVVAADVEWAEPSLGWKREADDHQANGVASH